MFVQTPQKQKKILEGTSVRREKENKLAYVRERNELGVKTNSVLFFLNETSISFSIQSQTPTKRALIIVESRNKRKEK